MPSQTVSKSAADYSANGPANRRCGICSMFRDPDRCTLVEGQIASDGTCRYWEARK